MIVRMRWGELRLEDDGSGVHVLMNTRLYPHIAYRIFLFLFSLCFIPLCSFLIAICLPWIFLLNQGITFSERLGNGVMEQGVLFVVIWTANGDLLGAVKLLG